MIRSRLLVIALLLSSAALSACNPGQPTAGQAEDPAGEQIVATFGDQSVTMAELETRAKHKLVRIEQDRYATLRETLDQLAVEKMMIDEAEARGITPEALMKSEVEDKVSEPREEQIRQYYRRNKEKAGNRSYEELYDLIVETIKRNQAQEYQRQYIAELKEKNGFRVHLDVARSEIEAMADELIRGADDAPVTIVEFADFQCPYCKTVHPSMERLLVEYGDRIRFIYRDFPLASLHERAVPASEAARCAADQDGFWDYYQHLMVMNGDMGDEDLIKRATEIGLDVDQFSDCYYAGTHKETVQISLEIGASLGVNSTPTFFINGRRVIGSKTYDELKTFIEEELARAESPNVGG